MRFSIVNWRKHRRNAGRFDWSGDALDAESSDGSIEQIMYRQSIQTSLFHYFTLFNKKMFPTPSNEYIIKIDVFGIAVETDLNFSK